MNGRDVLAEAHKRMTPAQIAEHALDLCSVIVRMDQQTANLHVLIRKLDEAVNTASLLAKVPGPGAVDPAVFHRPDLLPLFEAKEWMK